VEIIYVGVRRTPGGEPAVFVESREGQTVSSVVLDPGPSRRLYDHSPDGFEWGYGGSGPAQLALGILLDAGLRSGDRFTRAGERALRFYQEFKRLYVTSFAAEGFRLRLQDVVQFLH